MDIAVCPRHGFVSTVEAIDLEKDDDRERSRRTPPTG